MATGGARDSRRERPMDRQRRQDTLTFRHPSLPPSIDPPGHPGPTQVRVPGTVRLKRIDIRSPNTGGGLAT